METKTIVLIVVASIILITIPIAFVLINSGIVDVSGLNPMGTKTIRVVAVGKLLPEQEADISSETYKEAGIYYQGSFMQEMVFPGSLKPFNIVILEGQTTCDEQAVTAISDWVKQGGKLIIIGNACLNDNGMLKGIAIANFANVPTKSELLNAIRK